MKKSLSIVLFFAMMAALLLPIVPVYAAEPALPSANLTFDDWQDPFAVPCDRYASLATTVASINNNPAGILAPLGGQTWNHVTMPLMFDKSKTYVVSYDITVLEQPGLTELQPARLVPFANCTVYSSEATYLTDRKTDVTFDSNNSATVTPGVWTHTVGTITIPSWVWWTVDSFGFYEDGNVNSAAASTFAIDNLVIMEQSEFEAAYPEGVPAREDSVVGYSKLIADFDHTRFTAFRSTLNGAGGRLGVDLRGDSILTWNRASSSVTAVETSLNIPFNFESGKTYRVGFDVAANSNGKGTQFELAASATAATTDANANLQKFVNTANESVVTLADTSWIHVDMTLTAGDAASFFTLSLSENSIAKKSKIYFDNLAISEISEFPTDMALRTDGIDNIMYETFDKGTGSFDSVYWGTNNDLSVALVERDGQMNNVLNWKATTAAPSWNKLNVSYYFKANTTYVISFDAMVYGVQTGTEISTEGVGATSVALFTMGQDWTGYEGGSNHGQVAVQAGTWTRVTYEITPTAKHYYLGLCELPGNANNGCLYIDNFAICEKGKEVTSAGHSITLGDQIGVNFLLNAKDHIQNDATVTVKNGEKVLMTAGFDEAIEVAGAYQFTAPVAAKEMGDALTLTVQDGNVVLYTETYSVLDYAKTILEDEVTYAKEIPLVKAMLNYGGYSQAYFTYNTDALVNATIDNTLGEVTLDDSHNVVVAGSAVEGIVGVSATLKLESKTQVVFIVTFADNANLADYKVNGVTPTEKEMIIVLDGINANALDTKQILTISKDGAGQTISYAPTTFIKNTLARSDKDSLVNMVKALYAYYAAAVTYAAGN